MYIIEDTTGYVFLIKLKKLIYLIIHKVLTFIKNMHNYDYIYIFLNPKPQKFNGLTQIA